MRSMATIALILGSAVASPTALQAGAWIPNSIAGFTDFQKALKAGEAKGIWDSLAPESQKAADAAAKEIREKYAAMSAAEKAKVESALKPATDVAKVTGMDLVGTKAFLDMHAHFLKATKPQPGAGPTPAKPAGAFGSIKMAYTEGDQMGSVLLISVTADKQNYKMILAMPTVP